MYKRALVTLDGSALAEAIVPFIVEIAGPLDLEIVLLRVLQPMPPVTEGSAYILVKDIDAWFAEAREYLATIAAQLRARGVRRMGSAVIYLAYVAAGSLDGYWELRLGPWDLAAGSLLVEEAGGRITDVHGEPMDLAAPSVVASNGRIHDAMLAVLKGAHR